VLNGLPGDYNLSITNILGQTMLKSKITSNGHYAGNVNLSGYGEGIYLISLNGKNLKLEKKIVVY
jgi:hypothetical protein